MLFLYSKFRVSEYSSNANTWCIHTSFNYRNEECFWYRCCNALVLLTANIIDHLRQDLITDKRLGVAIHYIEETTNTHFKIRALSVLEASQAWTFPQRRRGGVVSASDSLSVDACHAWVWTTTKDSQCFLEHDTLPSLFSTGLFQERIGAWFTFKHICLFHNQTKIK